MVWIKTSPVCRHVRHALPLTESTAALMSFIKRALSRDISSHTRALQPVFNFAIESAFPNLTGHRHAY